MILLFCIKIDINWEHDWKGYGKANENKNKNGKKKSGRQKLEIAVYNAVELYATMSVFERRIHLSKSNTRIVSIQVEWPSTIITLPLNFVQKHKINHKFLLKIKTFDMEHSVYIYTIR